MTSMNPVPANQKLVETNQHPNTLPEESRDPDVAASALNQLVEHSNDHSDVRHGIHAPFHKIASIPLVHKLVPGIEKLADKFHVGNFVVVRGGDKFFESMPIYPR